jgi:hypothetical protein
MREAGKTPTRVYTMVETQIEMMTRNCTEPRELDLQRLKYTIPSARNHAFYGWARADLNHRIPGFPDAE